MGKHKKKFIDKKEAISFQLIHRSQRDPLQADSDTPGRILHPLTSNQGTQRSGDHVEPSTSGSGGALSREEENAKYGIFFDNDGYDYMQHLRPRGAGVLVLDDSVSSRNESRNPANRPLKSFGTNVKLPGELFASEYEEEEGMLSKGVLPRGPQPDWDPDIVACLDDAIDLDDPDNILEDDFVLKANADTDYNEFHSGTNEYGGDSGSDYCDSDAENGSEFSFSSEEGRSQGTHYSMTSSVIRRTQELKILDDRFDKILEEYEDEEIGGLEGEDISGHVMADEALGERIMGELMQECPKTLSEVTTQDDTENPLQHPVLENGRDTDSESDNEPVERFVEKDKEKWDCESILSTYSTLYNHPKLICEPKGEKTIHLTKKHGIPVGVLESKNLPQSHIKSNNTITANKTIRTKDESQDERKLRKQAVKEERRLRRSEKKATKLMFKSEHLKQEKVIANSKVQQGLKI